ncbi:uncharacterized protein BDV17DRAFT_34916 [Aspergillus undulatus]|uniref:uncharacterized protein n=1 Tax=Aspergillus undulatus TaxID=1810928 RepID=UPI003CCCE27A
MQEWHDRLLSRPMSRRSSQICDATASPDQLPPLTSAAQNRIPRPLSAEGAASVLPRSRDSTFYLHMAPIMTRTISSETPALLNLRRLKKERRSFNPAIWAQFPISIFSAAASLQLARESRRLVPMRASADEPERQRQSGLRLCTIGHALVKPAVDAVKQLFLLRDRKVCLCLSFGSPVLPQSRVDDPGDADGKARLFSLSLVSLYYSGSEARVA